jgi:hypothetical protein
MAALATVDDLVAVVGREFADTELTRVQRLLELASGLVRGECGQTLSAVTADTVTLPGTWEADLLLPEFPVTAVASVTIDSQPVDPADYAWNSYGTLYRACSTWGGPDAAVTVVYDHGYTAVPDDIVAVVCGVVNGQLTNPAGVRSESIGQRSVTFAGDGASIGAGLQLAGYQRAVLHAYGRRAWTVKGKPQRWPISL